MKKFIVKSFLFFCLIAAVFFAVVLNYKRTINIDTDYIAAIIDKHKRLDSIKENRLILIGGSNLPFGIDGKMLSDSLQTNTINMGLHAGLGLEFMLNEVESSIKKNDVIVLCLEYPLYLDDAKTDVDLIDYAQEVYPPAKKYHDFTIKEKLLVGYEKFEKTFNKKELDINAVFNRKQFNLYGDNIGYLNLPSEKVLKNKEAIGKIELTESLKLIQDFNISITNKGARLLISYPSYELSQYQKNESKIIELDKKLRANLNGITFLNKPETFAFDAAYFYDTVYHLNGKGREKRTRIFLEELRVFLK
jgi:hypothetical protein